MAKEVLTGIYKITNLDNGKMYVGQAKDIYKRWGEHKTALRNNKHSNSRLQNSWNLHGEEKFEFSIIEECDFDELNDLEMYWVEKLRTYINFSDSNGYNLTLGGDGTRMFTKELVSPICEMYNNGFGNVPEIAAHLGWESKKVRRYLKFGTLLGICNYDAVEAGLAAHQKAVICLNNKKIFSSCKEAEEYYGIHGIASCCVGKHKYAGRDEYGSCLIWMHLDKYEQMSDQDLEKYIIELTQEIYSMNVVCLNNNIVFDNTLQAAEFAGLKSQNSIQSCCNGITKHAGKDPVTNEYYVWVYIKDYIKMTKEELQIKYSEGQVSTTNPPKKVICLNTMNEFDSPLSASKWAIDTNQEIIKSCCRDERNTAGKSPIDNKFLTWMYYEDYINASESKIKEKLDLTNYYYTNPDRRRKIVCLNNLFLFNGLKEAGNWCGIKNANNIGYRLRQNSPYSGKHPETGEKLKWMYYDDYIKNNSEENLIIYQDIMELKGV